MPKTATLRCHELQQTSPHTSSPSEPVQQIRPWQSNIIVNSAQVNAPRQSKHSPTTKCNEARRDNARRHGYDDQIYCCYARHHHAHERL